MPSPFEKKVLAVSCLILVIGFVVSMIFRQDFSYPQVIMTVGTALTLKSLLLRYNQDKVSDQQLQIDEATQKIAILESDLSKINLMLKLRS